MAQPEDATAAGSNGSAAARTRPRSGCCASTTRAAAPRCTGSGPVLLPPAIEPIAVQLPGRADRFGEPAFDRMAPLVDELVEVLKPLLDRPFACYGVSMGSRVAWALAHALRERGRCRCRACSSSRATSRRSTTTARGRGKGVRTGSRATCGRWAARHPRSSPNRSWCARWCRTLRADLTVLSTHRFRPDAPLDVRIHGVRRHRRLDGASRPDGRVAGRDDRALRPRRRPERALLRPGCRAPGDPDDRPRPYPSRLNRGAP